MAFDPRQVVAAFLTLSMFAMLGNMIKQDHFDSYEVRLPTHAVHLDAIDNNAHGNNAVPEGNQGPWMEKSPELKPCWNKPASKEGEQSKGFITFSLTTGPEYHLSQITDAVVITRYLGATLVLPDIRGSELGQKWNFEDVYDIEKFMKNLDGVVKIVKELPAEVTAGKPAVVRVPNRVSEDFITKNIEPIFRTKSYLRLAIVFPSINLRQREKQSNDLDSTSCLAMFGSLELKPEIQGVADTMVQRLRTLSRKSDGRFVAVDLRVDALEQKGCKESGSNGRKNCYSAHEVSDFLKRVGFDGDTTVYLTQTWWHDSLNILKENFPKTYTKDDIIPAEKKGEFLRAKSGELETALDLHICTQSDAFVPAISGLFYGNVAGKRISSGKTQILVPSERQSSTASDFISTYVSQKNHLVYSCYC
ncbi:uncharacterized protein A4U43_C05F24220 [Asparagus officinalis]|uniref:O-fucosyltransferase family protein n=1 Tax=Asparagus officinalis TaxID=4686 RepID=A0A5P1EU96_ASPOF|nr:uncharacterized protein LOC109840396 [Asparagus officinalis]ONK69556.1 uncharacterized protein A4U43_C05F24220 [Asparagus officinalis]